MNLIGTSGRPKPSMHTRAQRTNLLIIYREFYSLSRALPGARCGILCIHYLTLVITVPKRWFDATSAALCLLILAPLMLLVAAIVRSRMGSPVLFRQSRIGRHNVVFELVKFRSMTSLADESSTPLHDELRLSAFGLWLRRTSLDELPSLWNVLCGHMSLVGPRPLLVQYLPLYSPIQARRHEVRPGITGLAQVNGRNAISWERKFELDVWYVDNRSVWLDLKILLLTGLRVFQRRGISAEGSVSMPFFTGSDESKLTSELSQPKPAIRASTELS